MQMRTRRLASVAVAAMTVAATTGVEPALADAPVPALCGGPADSCSVPFPSQALLVPDSQSATGYRFADPSKIVRPEVQARMGPGGTLSDAFGSSDGYSPLAPVVFQLPGNIDPKSLPVDGGEVAVVQNASTGERVRIRAEVSKYYTESNGQHSTILLWPATKFDYGERYVASLRTGLRNTDGTPAAKAIGLGRVRRSMSMSSVVSRRANSAETRAARQVVRDKRLALMLDGDNRWESYLAVTSFVVSSERSITGDVDRMAAEIRAVDHPIKNVAVAPSLAAGGATVSGQVQVTDFRNSDSVIANDGTAVGKPRWVNFMMTVPISAKHAPIAIYGHGLTASKETQLIVTETNLARGIATIGIDVPDHGGRAGEGGPLLDITFPETMGRLSGMLLQGELDQLSLLMAITHHFGEIDLAPFKFSMTPGDGIADFDPERVYYEATSMGGVLGLVFLGLAPEVDGAFIQVAGAGILDTLLHSDILWPAFGRVVPRNADAGEANVIIGASQRLIDRGDPTYYLQRVQDYKMPLYLVYSVDDGVVSNGGTERMANLLGLPLVGQQFGPITPGTVSGHVDSMPADGRGVQQIPTAYLNGNFAKPFLSHLAFVDPIPMHAFRDWLDDRLATPR